MFAENLWRRNTSSRFSSGGHLVFMHAGRPAHADGPTAESDWFGDMREACWRSPNRLHDRHKICTDRPYMYAQIG